jgi:hypothetical protein
MPFYNHKFDWNGLNIQTHPLEAWRKRYNFWPYFVGQQVKLELRVQFPEGTDPNNVQFHLVEKMSEQAKPSIIPVTVQTTSSTNNVLVYIIQNSSRITGKGEVKYWLSNRGYNVDSEPIFSAEAVNPDTWILPLITILIGPLIGFLFGLVVGLLLN